MANSLAMPVRRIRPHVGVVAVVALVATTACHKESPAPAEGPPEEHASAAQAASLPAPASEFHESAFELSVRSSDSYAVGKPASLDIVLVPKGGYHTNDKYPYKLKLEPGAGVKFPSEVVTKDAVTLEPMRATMKVDLVPQTAGAQQVSGQFSFSVCSAERCLVEKRDVTTTIRVN